MSEPWRFTGSIWEFVDLVQWVLVVWQASEKNHPDRMKVLTDDAVSDRVAAEYGITPYSVAAEMKRIAPKIVTRACERFVMALTEGPAIALI